MVSEHSVKFSRLKLIKIRPTYSYISPFRKFFNFEPMDATFSVGRSNKKQN